MALLPILHHPDPRLREKARPITRFDDILQRLINDMFETLYAAPGVGLAATQVGVAQRLAVVDCSRDETKRKPLVLINPELLHQSEPHEVEEGCLSLPGVSEKLTRYHKVRVRALDREGVPFELEAEELLAQCVQHELDHLNGKLYIDRLSSLKRERLLKRQKEVRGEA